MPATTDKPPTVAKELAALDRMTAAELRDKYAELFGEPAASGNRAWLARRVGWRMQALAEGDLTHAAVPDDHPQAIGRRRSRQDEPRLALAHLPARSQVQPASGPVDRPVG